MVDKPCRRRWIRDRESTPGRATLFYVFVAWASVEEGGFGIPDVSPFSARRCGTITRKMSSSGYNDLGGHTYSSITGHNSQYCCPTGNHLESRSNFSRQCSLDKKAKP